MHFNASFLFLSSSLLDPSSRVPRLLNVYILQYACEKCVSVRTCLKSENVCVLKGWTTALKVDGGHELEAPF